MKMRPDLVTEASPSELEVFQLTTEEGVPSSHIYMEAQIFTPDSRRLILHRSAHPHGSDRCDPEHQYLVCDLENGGELVPITTELGTTAPSVSPEGQTLYYFVDETYPGGGTLTLKRVAMDGGQRETLLVVDAPIPATNYRPSRPYPLSTISSDGKKLALSAFLGDGETEDAPWGLLVFDLEKAAVELILEGQSWCNVHPQYCRSLDAEERRDILIQENHGNKCDSAGAFLQLTGGEGADIHVICDDGSHFRDMPWGRDGNEFCQGHQCWIGRTTRALTSTGTRNPPSERLIEGRAVEPSGHLGLAAPGARRNDLSRAFPHPNFYHFATDIEGYFFISDAGPKERGGSIYLGQFSEAETSPLRDMTFLLNPHSSWKKDTHMHPFLSPDGRMAFFNSDESGVLQAYMMRGW